jgi:hypothetical protein
VREDKKDTPQLAAGRIHFANKSAAKSEIFHCRSGI